ncbi:MAG: hypothetical protein ACRC50_06805 [Gaiella sp.]
MHWTRRTLAIVGTAIAAVALLVGVGVAVAASDDDAEELSALAERIRTKDAFDKAVAEKLGTTAAALQRAIAKAATARIDAAEQSGSLSAADADLLRDEVASGDRLAMHLAEAAAVADALGVTEEKLDAAYAAVQKATALARVEAALKADRITKTVADELKARIAQTEFPGFDHGGRGPHGGHGRHGGSGHGPFGGHGDGHGPLGGGLGPMGGQPGPGFDADEPAAEGATPAVFA